jgi:molecular chaperone GrpE
MQSSPASDARREGPEERENATEPGHDDATAAERDLTGELAALEDRYKRALADLENYRKRSARELDRRVGESREAVIGDWLEALDSVERALRMEPQGTAAAGLQAVLEQMETILRREGIQRIGAAGEPFDPERFEAVGVRGTNEVPDRTVLEVVRSGFGSDGRVLRPAQVIVADANRRDGS